MKLLIPSLLLPGIACVLSLLVIPVFPAKAQEGVAPLQYNSALISAAKNRPENLLQKPTTLSLPFFEDFVNDGPYPDESRWRDKNVWVNNNMGVSVISRGVATFDALDQWGKPYDTLTAQSTVLADSLTSQYIDLSAYDAGDSLYLSFYYQPQGNGFFPKPQDSLILYLHYNNGVWQQVWGIEGETLDSFKQVMIPITAANSFYDSFEFRFVNKATLGYSNSQWNVDYIRLDAGRSFADTLVQDVAYTIQPTSLLNDFTAMPAKHFATAPASFLKTELSAIFRHSGFSVNNVNYGYNARVVGGPNIGTGSGSVGGISPFSSIQTFFPMYSFTPPGSNFTVENKYYLSDIYPNAPVDNDTVVQYQEFGNYFAYDDGTAEKSYFLNLAPQSPGKVAVEYAMYTPDTLRGLAIRFVRQVPGGWNKDFSIVVYKSIGLTGGVDTILYEQEYLFPMYEDTMNELSVYAFDEPLVMPAGIYYIGVVLPASGSSDSLQIALDVNREGGTHRYYNVEDTWQTSLLQGALLMRPLVGPALPMAAGDIKRSVMSWDMYPNPATDRVRLVIPVSEVSQAFKYRLVDLNGRVIQSGSLFSETTTLDIKDLSKGVYFLQITDRTGKQDTKKLVVE